MSGNEKLERELESFLAEENSRVAALYRKLPRNEPDAALDASVLAMARNAVAPRRSRNLWLPGLSAAAAVLIVAGVAYRAGPQVWNDRGERATAPISSAADEAKTATVSPASPPAAAAPPVLEPASPMTTDLGVNTPKPVSAPAQAAPADALARRKTGEMPRLQSAAPRAFPQPQASAIQTEAKRTDKSSATPAPPAREAPLQSLDTAISPSDESQKAEAAAEAMDREKDGAPGRTGAVNATQPQPRSASASASAQFAPSPPAAAMSAPDNRLYPEHWLSNIQKLIRANRRDEAIRSLDEFRKQYPDYRLPDDLRDLK